MSHQTDFTMLLDCERLYKKYKNNIYSKLIYVDMVWRLYILVCTIKIIGIYNKCFHTQNQLDKWAEGIKNVYKQL